MALINPRDDSEPAPQAPYRIQYKMKEAAYMMSVSENILKEWCCAYDIPIYTIGDDISGKKHKYVRHDDLVLIIKRGAVATHLAGQRLVEATLEGWERNRGDGKAP